MGRYYFNEIENILLIVCIIDITAVLDQIIIVLPLSQVQCMDYISLRINVEDEKKIDGTISVSIGESHTIILMSITNQNFWS